MSIEADMLKKLIEAEHLVKLQIEIVAKGFDDHPKRAKHYSREIKRCCTAWESAARSLIYWGKRMDQAALDELPPPE